MEKSLDRFLHYLRVEKGFPESTTQAYWLDIGKGLIPFLKQRGKSSLKRVAKDDIRAHLDYLATVRGNGSATRARKLAAIKSFFNYLVANEGLRSMRGRTLHRVPFQA
jgi:site-specific recombinase XerD